MTIRIVQLGSPRGRGEGLRIGTVRRPPRGVRKEDFARRDFYDVWFPTLSPSQALLKELFPIDEDRIWKKFRRGFLAEMKEHEPKHALDLFAALSHTTNFAIGCYCEDESLCHRSLLRELLTARDADIQ